MMGVETPIPPVRMGAAAPKGAFAAASIAGRSPDVRSNFFPDRLFRSPAAERPEAKETTFLQFSSIWCELRFTPFLLSFLTAKN